jgi:hypothetical protein
MLKQGFIQGVNPMGEKPVPFDEFVEKFLKAGGISLKRYLSNFSCI